MKNTIMLFIATVGGLMGQAPSVLSVSPSGGIGTGATFTFLFQDSAGYSSITGLDIDFGTGTTNTCYIAYQAGYIYLADNSGTPETPLPLGSSGNSGTLTNSQCTLNVAASSISGSGTYLTLNLAISFFASYSGPHTINALAVASTLNSGWAAPGTYTVSYGPPSTLSVSPGSGSGATQSFEFLFSDPGGIANIAALYADLGVTAVNTCYVTYQAGMLYLAADNGFFGSPLPIGGSGTLSNSQCSINVGSSSISGSGIHVTLTLAVSFLVPYSGPHTTYAVAYNNEGQNSSWQDLGTWWAGSLNMSSNPSDFQTCIGLSGTANTCMLATGPHPMSSTLTIGRGSTSTAPLVIITGAGGPGDTVLVRANSSPTSNDMMGVSNGVTNVTISYLTFDGNRYGFGVSGAGLSCLVNNPGIYDLNLTYNGETTTGMFTAEWLDFVNAPGTALLLDGPGSSVSVSNFGQGGNSGIGADGTHYPTPTGDLEPADQSATRATAIYIDGSNNGAWYNNISYAGTAGITLNGAGQYAYGNSLYQNRYELSDGSGGGALTLNGPGPGQPTQSSNALVAGNVINGNFWPSQISPPVKVNGCPFPGINQSPGIEVYGSGHRLYNNEVYQNTGSGMTFAGSCDFTNGQPNGGTPCPVKDITISGVNYVPNSNDSPKYVEGNQFGGIWFRSGCSTCDASMGVTLDNLLVWNNAKWGINLSGVSIDPSNPNPINGGAYAGFISQTCMSNTTYPNVTSTYPNALGNSGVPPNPNPYSSYTNPYANPPWTGGTCPGRPGGTATPAPSNIPGWPW